MNKPCVRTQIVLRRVSRHPVVRAGSRIQKHVVRGATLSIVPDVVNDLTFHHAKLDVSEIVHALQDTTTISVLNLILATALVSSRLELPSRKD